tara:strand:+ start:66 stop:1808 length:1743 start_codon:yes stop_codon:yes gene_type:complete
MDTQASKDHKLDIFVENAEDSASRSPIRVGRGTQATMLFNEFIWLRWWNTMEGQRFAGESKDKLRVHVTDHRMWKSSRVYSFYNIVFGGKEVLSGDSGGTAEVVIASAKKEIISAKAKQFGVQELEDILFFLHSKACVPIDGPGGDWNDITRGRDMLACLATFGWDPDFISPTKVLPKPPETTENPRIYNVHFHVTPEYYDHYKEEYDQAKKHDKPLCIIEFFIKEFGDFESEDPRRLVEQLKKLFDYMGIKEIGQEGGDPPVLLTSEAGKGNFCANTTRLAKQFIKLHKALQESAAGFVAYYHSTTLQCPDPGYRVPPNALNGNDFMYDCFTSLRLTRTCGYIRDPDQFRDRPPENPPKCIISIGGDGVWELAPPDPLAAHGERLAARHMTPGMQFSHDGQLSGGHMSACFRFLNAVGVIENMGIGGVSKAPRIDCVRVNLARELFDMFDADGDSKLNKSEYKKYLIGIGMWGNGSYTEERWDARWPQECVALNSDTEGVGREAFGRIIYGKTSTKDKPWQWNSVRNVHIDHLRVARFHSAAKAGEKKAISEEKKVISEASGLKSSAERGVANVASTSA